MTGGRIILAIETSNPSLAPASVAVARLSGRTPIEVLVAESLAPRGRHDDALMPTIARACMSAGVTPGRVARVAVSVGPGGFSGLRIACATAQMIALASGAECVAVPTALVAAERCFARDAGVSAALVALASKGDSAWVTIVDRADGIEARARAARAGEALDAAGVLRLIGSHRPDVALADARLPASLREALGARGVVVSAPGLDAGTVARLGALLTPTPPDRLTPIYPREPEAVRKWRELGR